MTVKLCDFALRYGYYLIDESEFDLNYFLETFYHGQESDHLEFLTILTGDKKEYFEEHLITRYWTNYYSERVKNWDSSISEYVEYLNHTYKICRGEIYYVLRHDVSFLNCLMFNATKERDTYVCVARRTELLK